MFILCKSSAKTIIYFFCLFRKNRLRCSYMNVNVGLRFAVIAYTCSIVGCFSIDVFCSYCIFVCYYVLLYLLNLCLFLFILLIYWSLSFLIYNQNLKFQMAAGMLLGWQLCFLYFILHKMCCFMCFCFVWQLYSFIAYCKLYILLLLLSYLVKLCI